MYRPFVIAGALLALGLHPAAAQQPTQAQRDAVRASCRSDFMANCASVTPGGKEALECLLRNQAKLSPACNSAVSAIAPPETSQKPPAPAAQAPAPSAPAQSAPAAAAAEPTAPKPAAASAAEPAPKPAATQEAQLKAVRQSCTLNDFMAHCSWIKPSNPELVLCLQSNASDLSPPCQAAVQGLPPPAAQTPSAAPERKPTAEKPSKKSTGFTRARPACVGLRAARRICRTGQRGAEVCHPRRLPVRLHSELFGRAARRRRRAAMPAEQCGKAVGILPKRRGGHWRRQGWLGLRGAALLGAGREHADAGRCSAQADPADAPPREALGILAMCRVEQQTICGGIPFGGGRVLTCLADHAPQLSLQCYEALARATR